MDLDIKNKVLFEHLLKYARFSVKDLARILKVSKATVIKRLKFLEEKEYISRYDAIINWQKIPFIKKIYFVKVDKESKEFERQMISKKPVFSLITLSGLYNYQVWCFFKTKKQQSEFEKQLRFTYKEINVSELTFPVVSFFDLPLQLSIPKINENILKIKSIDVGIMKHMAQGNGRDSFYEMSAKLKLPYDSVHYHGKNLLRAGYFSTIIAQPGTSKFTLQTTCLLIQCVDNEESNKLYNLLQKTPKILSNAISKESKVLVHFLSQTHLEYRETLSKILSIISRNKIKDVLITHWDKVLLNNRYPLEYFLD
ncbi:MAG: Lrp/AsnC family transcriptional regulator [Patescibacteria group bacterium]